jgi:hypothetical protein
VVVTAAQWLACNTNVLIAATAATAAAAAAAAAVTVVGHTRYSIDEHILGLLDIKPVTWAVLIGLLLANWGRVAIEAVVKHDSHSTKATEEHHSSSSSHYDDTHTSAPVDSHATSAPTEAAHHRMLRWLAESSAG